MPGSTSLRWTVHPAASEPGRTLLVLAIIALAAVFTLAVTRSGLLALAASLALLGSLRAWFLPRTYVVDDSGAREEGPLQAPRSLSWADVRAVTRERCGVHLSPLHGRRRWLPDRGVFLRTGRNTEEVATFVLARCSER
ncbi:MAG TPA: hypothetical protein VFD43_13480 [Planctomycetota bacterium]|nr:hypothetical protein [Planctomycetota bacterium]